MLVAVTGTPGTGKSSACEVLARRGRHVVDLDQAARDLGLMTRDGSDMVVDVDALARRLEFAENDAIVRSHYAHRMPVGLIVVLRCHPKELWRRLEEREWPVEKIRENVEAEAIDVILQEAVTRNVPVWEVDTTGKTPEACAEEILDVLGGKVQGHEPGRLDWSEEVLWIGARGP